jgi:hypothetical protein
MLHTVTDLASFLLDCFCVLESGVQLSRHKIRHALSIGAPLGTPSASIDTWCQSVCDVLISTGVVAEHDGVFYFVKPDDVNTN